MTKSANFQNSLVNKHVVHIILANWHNLNPQLINNATHKFHRWISIKNHPGDTTHSQFHRWIPTKGSPGDTTQFRRWISSNYSSRWFNSITKSTFHRWTPIKHIQVNSITTSKQEIKCQLMDTGVSIDRFQLTYKLSQNKFALHTNNNIQQTHTSTSIQNTSYYINNGINFKFNRQNY